MVNLYQNEKLILSNYKGENIKNKLKVSLDDNTTVFKLEAVNEGRYPPNTAMLIITGDRQLEMQSNLKKGETTSISIMKPQ